MFEVLNCIYFFSKDSDDVSFLAPPTPHTFATPCCHVNAICRADGRAPGHGGLCIDCGYLVLVRTQLQNAADSRRWPRGFIWPINLRRSPRLRNTATSTLPRGARDRIAAADVQFGVWDIGTRTFTVNANGGNAIRVTARCSKKTGGEAQLFFGQFLGVKSVDMQASAVVSAKPRDIAFVCRS